MRISNDTLMKYRRMQFTLLAFLCAQMVFGNEPADLKEFEYARVDEISLKLDLHRCGEQTGPLLLWIHGGAWRSGSKSNMPLKELVCSGYPVASVDYRLSTTAKFPAQIHDVKAAIRFLRAVAGDIGIDARVVVVGGDSAGGHLASLVGVSNGDERLEGR